MKPVKFNQTENTFSGMKSKLINNHSKEVTLNNLVDCANKETHSFNCQTLALTL